jgi:hypothetical protein
VSGPTETTEGVMTSRAVGMLEVLLPATKQPACRASGAAVRRIARADGS